MFVERYKDFTLDKARKSSCKYRQAFIPHQHKIIWLKKCHMSEGSLNELFLTRPCHDLLSKIWPYGSLYFTCPWKGVLEGRNLSESRKYRFSKKHGIRLVLGRKYGDCLSTRGVPWFCVDRDLTLIGVETPGKNLKSYIESYNHTG